MTRTGVNARSEGANPLNMDLVAEIADSYMKTAEGSEAARIRFMRGLWELQEGIESSVRTGYAIDGETAREALVAGQPLFMRQAPQIGLDEYLDAVSRVASYVEEEAGLPAEQAAALAAADFASAVTSERLSGVLQSLDGFIGQVAGELGAGLTEATVAFVLVTALVPFLTGPAEEAMAAVGDFDRSTWPHGHCPVCGAPAAVGKMGESTKLKGAERTLWCGVCHSEWGYDRIRCVRCGTRNPDSLRYTHVEGDSAHRLHLCDECHGYARFVFTDDLGKRVSMIVEDAVSATLEGIAQEMGYTSTGDGGAGSC